MKIKETELTKLMRLLVLAPCGNTQLENFIRRIQLNSRGSVRSISYRTWTEDMRALLHLNIVGSLLVLHREFRPIKKSILCTNFHPPEVRCSHLYTDNSTDPKSKFKVHSMPGITSFLYFFFAAPPPPFQQVESAHERNKKKDTK